MPLFRHTPRIIALSLLIATLGACSTSQPPQAAAPLMKIDQIYLGALSSKPAVAQISGHIGMLYATSDNRVAFRLEDKTTLLDGNLKIRGGQFFQLKQFGSKLYALWWSHQDEKNLYSAVSSDAGKNFAPAQIISTDHGVLPPFSLVGDASGMKVGLVHMDEREPRFEVYFTRTTDGGASWEKPDVRLDTPPAPPQPSEAMFPALVQSGATWVVSWTDTTKVDGRVVGRLLARRSTDEGQHWSPPRVLYQSDSLLTGMVSKAEGNTVLVVLQDTMKGVVAVESKDSGEGWQVLPGASGSSKTNNSGIKIALSNGKAYVVWMAQASSNVQGKASKAEILASVIDTKIGQWLGEPQRIDSGKPLNQTMSLEPDITVTGSGVPAITWTDFRNIRPNIYLSASFDSGKSWTAPQDIEVPGEYSTLFSSIFPRKDSVIVQYEKFPTDSRTKREAYVREFSLEKPIGFVDIPAYKAISKAEKESKLKERVDKFWKLRVDGKFSETYEYFDPAFKNAFTKTEFDKHQGNFIYHSAKLEKMIIDDNVATVTEKVNYEVKSTQIAGQTVKIPPTDSDITSTWVWIFDNWYEIYQPPFGAPLLNY